MKNEPHYYLTGDTHTIGWSGRTQPPDVLSEAFVMEWKPAQTLMVAENGRLHVYTLWVRK